MERRVVVGLGDSTTAGTPGFLSPIEAPPDGSGNPQSQYGYWLVKNHPEWSFLNRGVSGERSDEIASRFERDVLREAPQVVIILAGVNDIFQGRAAGSVKRNLAEMYRTASRYNIAPLAATILPYDAAGDRERESIAEVNAWIEMVSMAEGMLFCDTNLAVRDPADRHRLASTTDGLHPDVAGYRKMGEAMASVLERHFG